MPPTDLPLPPLITFWLALLGLGVTQGAGGAAALGALRAWRYRSAGHPARWALSAWACFPLSVATYTTAHLTAHISGPTLERLGLTHWLLAPLELIAFGYGVTRLAAWAARE